MFPLVSLIVGSKVQALILNCNTARSCGVLNLRILQFLYQSAMGVGTTEGMPDDEEVAKQIESLRESSENIENLLDLMISAKAYDRLSTEDQVKHDLFVSYALTSVYWMYMRTQGGNPFNHVVKGEIDRIQDYVKKYQRVKDRKKRPTVQKNAVKRFVKSGLWDPSKGPQPSNKRKTFEDDDD
ncbi:hypothetical protein GE061_012189 [Apolygus lucorum]|uniref:Nuclear nucleic acid-binding protein C1D n=1 Tax=Apolygus lucorum TaxID=248454 RepID=A0A6A4JUZ9_APOLU|nr:hypothetical protein GE061_012189 [Apolygus lucorum]